MEKTKLDNFNSQINIGEVFQQLKDIWQALFDFEFIEAKKLAVMNLKRVSHNEKLDCIDERPEKSGEDRLAKKLSGASLAPLVLQTLNENKPLAEEMEQWFNNAKKFYWHDDDHNHQIGMTGCGANDHLREIVIKFLTKVKGKTEQEAREITERLIVPNPAEERIKQAQQIKPDQVVKVSSLKGPHTANDLFINLENGTTLIHQNYGESALTHFVVDPEGDIDQINFALATVNVLSEPGKLKVYWSL